MRILLTGSGGGGHIIPLIAVVKELKTLANKIGIFDLEFMYLGPKIEEEFSRQLLTKEGIKIKFIRAYKLRRYFSIHNFIDIINIPIGFFQSIFIILLFMPKIVFSKGGYGSVPVVIVSWLYFIPVIIHESDAIPGKANILNSKFAKKILVGFSKALKYFPVNKTAVVGNPVRLELLEGDIIKAKEKFSITSDKLVILIMGGSQGAQKINDVILNTLPELIKKYEIIHLTGEKNYKQVAQEAQVMIPKNFEMFYHGYPSLKNEIKDAYAASSIIISRSGASSIFEIALIGKPNILIPLKNSAGDHQRENAYEIDKFKGTIVLEEDNLTPHILLTSIDRLIKDKNLSEEMSKSLKIFSTPKAAENIAKEIFKTTGLII